MKNKKTSFGQLFMIALLISVSLVAGTDAQELKMADIFTDNMVLQRDMPITIYGTAEAGSEVKVRFNDVHYRTATNKSGAWNVALNAMRAGGPYTMIVSSTSDTLTIKNILIGDVWLCAGQSNMEFAFSYDIDAKSITNFKDQDLRLFTIDDVRKRNSTSNQWLTADSVSVADFSAIGYYFGRRLRTDLNVPIGLVDVSKGATACETWISREALKNEPGSFVQSVYQKFKKIDANYTIDRDMLFEWDQARLDYNRRNADYRRGLISEKPHPPDSPNVRKTPTCSYQMYLRPYPALKFKGVLWYQGESNAHTVDEGESYDKLLSLMIADWRRHFNSPNLPFYIVQLPDFKSDWLPGWSAVRISQMEAARNTSNTYYIVTTDIKYSDPQNIHPPVKKPIAKRLASMILKHTYSKNRNIDFPECDEDNIRIEDTNLVVPFKSTFGLESRGKEITGFEIIDHDGKILEPDVRFDGENTVVIINNLSMSSVLRYNGISETKGNLFNKLGYPAASFSISLNKK